MSKYFISYVLHTYNEYGLQTSFHNCIINLPHEIIDETDTKDIQSLIEKENNYNQDCQAVVITWFQKLPA